jgi:hypothetical protein
MMLMKQFYFPVGNTAIARGSIEGVEVLHDAGFF